MKRFVFVVLAVCVVTVGATRVGAQEEPKRAGQQTLPQAPSQATSQVASPVTSQVNPQPAPPVAAQVSVQDSQQEATAVATDKSKIVYVSDFELDALDANGKVEQNVSVTVPAPTIAPDPSRPEAPAEQARRLIDYMSATLVKELEKAGYTAERLRPTDDRPTDGIRINGIFAEPDAQNRLRRAVMGTLTVAGKMALFVGIGNLARPDQAFYAVANPSSAENKTETVITLSSYAPVAKFVIEKSVTEKAVKDTAVGIVANLNALLGANVVALTQ